MNDLGLVCADGSSFSLESEQTDNDFLNQLLLLPENIPEVGQIARLESLLRGFCNLQLEKLKEYYSSLFASEDIEVIQKQLALLVLEREQKRRKNLSEEVVKRRICRVITFTPPYNNNQEWSGLSDKTRDDILFYIQAAQENQPDLSDQGIREAAGRNLVLENGLTDLRFSHLVAMVEAIESPLFCTDKEILTMAVISAVTVALGNRPSFGSI